MVARAQLMKRDGVLVKVDRHRVNASEGVIICACGDCDQEKSYTDYLRQVVSDRMHHIRLNGGPLSISPDSPLYTDTDDDGQIVTVGSTQITQIRNSLRLKGIRAVVLVAHAPCGAALSANMSLDQVVTALLAAKRELVERYRESLNVRVACFLHLDWPKLLGVEPDDDVKPKTYFVSRERAELWLAKPPPLELGHLAWNVPTQAEFVTRE